MLSQLGHSLVNYAFKSKNQKFTKDNVDVIITKKGSYTRNYLNIYKLIKKVRPDVVISNFSYANPALLFGKLLGVDQNIVWFHSLDKQMESTKLNIIIKKKFLKLADQLIANSYLTKQELNDIYAVSEHKIKTLPFWSNIADTESSTNALNINKDSQTINIGCPGRMAKHKNQRIVIEALQMLKLNKRTNFHMYFAGVGEEFDNLNRMTEEAQLQDHITFNGHVSASNMIEYYKSMDVIILPSLHEAFGLVFIEAISLGVPVIVSSMFGALSFIDSNTEDLDQIIFDPKSSVDLKNKLELYLDHNGIPSDFFKTLYQENFNKTLIFEDFLTILEKN
ncbi:MAG: glycosyltransferase family 4 protein [Psychroserpens sp.]|nr:glycosyltransferase family 4 protein [Psychroserpens sp.]MBO6630990.1 glycosyltransferase family 4 protein [Psychroserpens sp.]MBO6915830.1 glycosyltransferase family 4 protein [Psychroserpens sp.]MBO6942991.1 glycosyltransferase family 4 protein [Psychroserpens sp.]